MVYLLIQLNLNRWKTVKNENLLIIYIECIHMSILHLFIFSDFTEYSALRKQERKFCLYT